MQKSLNLESQRKYWRVKWGYLSFKQSILSSSLYVTDPLIRSRFSADSAFLIYKKKSLKSSLSLGKTHIKKVGFFSGRTTKGVGRVNPPDH